MARPDLQRAFAIEASVVAKDLGVWADFREHGFPELLMEPPEADTVHEFAVEVLRALAIDEEGSFDGFNAVILALHAFMARVCTGFPPANAEVLFKQLRDALTTDRPVRLDVVRELFRQLTGGE